MTRGLLWVVPFNVGLNQRGMRERTLSIVRVRIGVVVKQNHWLILRYDTNRCYQFLEFVLQHPFVTGQVDQLAGSEVAKQFLTMNFIVESLGISIESLKYTPLTLSRPDTDILVPNAARIQKNRIKKQKTFFSLFASYSILFLMLSYQLYCFFTRQMLDIEADGQHTG